VYPSLASALRIGSIIPKFLNAMLAVCELADGDVVCSVSAGRFIKSGLQLAVLFYKVGQR
jgi:hypothetical protein